MSNQLQKPFSDIIGETSPIQKMLKLAWHFAEAKPETFANTIGLTEVIKIVYSKYIKQNPDLEKQILDLQKNIEEIILDFLKFIGKEKLDIIIAPELLRLK